MNLIVIVIWLLHRVVVIGGCILLFIQINKIAISLFYKQ